LWIEREQIRSVLCNRQSAIVNGNPRGGTPALPGSPKKSLPSPLQFSKANVAIDDRGREIRSPQGGNMRSRSFTVSLGVLILAALPAGLAAQERNSRLPRYSVTDLGTLGGTYSYAYGMNRVGVVSGGAATATQTGGVYQTAFLWDDDLGIIDLGTLGGEDCPDCNSEAGGPNAKGESPIVSETSNPAYRDEDFCALGTHRQCLGAIWKDGIMTALPTLPGGHNGQAFWINDQGQVVGFAENGTVDSNCASATPYQVLRFEAVIWNPNGAIHELHPLRGDTVGYAIGINERGQAVGVSGLCSDTHVPPISPGMYAPHAVLWEKDSAPVDLGSLGGGPFTVPGAINDRGEVGGASLSSEDGTVHPFLWTRQEGMRDLGTFPGAIVTGITCCGTLNNKGDAVGVTVDGTTFNMRAILVHNNRLIDLNTLIPPHSGWSLQLASSINDAGEIVGQGTIKGETHAFLLTPVRYDGVGKGVAARRHK
jgi:probable HAF family extracellular repeat protein